MWQEVIHILNTFMKNLALEIGNPYFKIEVDQADKAWRWSRIESNEFQIDFYRIFRIIFHLSIQSNCKFLNLGEQNLERIQFLII